MLSFSGHALFLNLLYYLTFYSDSIFVSYLYGPVVAAAYFATVVPAQQAWTLILRLMNNSVPGLNELLAKGDWAGARSAYYRICRYSLLLAAALSLGILGFNRMLVGIWVGPERYAGDSITVFLAILVPWCVLENVQIQFLLAIGRAKFLSRMCLLEGCTKLVQSLVLGRLMGPEGVLLGTLVASLAIAPWTWRECLRALDASPVGSGAGLFTAGAGLFRTAWNHHCVPGHDTAGIPGGVAFGAGRFRRGLVRNGLVRSSFSTRSDIPA